MSRRSRGGRYTAVATSATRECDKMRVWRLYRDKPAAAAADALQIIKGRVVRADAARRHHVQLRAREPFANEQHCLRAAVLYRRPDQPNGVRVVAPRRHARSRRLGVFGYIGNYKIKLASSWNSDDFAHYCHTSFLRRNHFTLACASNSGWSTSTRIAALQGGHVEASHRAIPDTLHIWRSR